METRNADVLSCPECKGSLCRSTPVSSPEECEILICNDCGNEYSDHDGYVDFLGSVGLIHDNLREKIVRTVYARFYTPMTNFMFIFCGGAGNARREVIGQLDIHDNDLILETGMGPGDNFPLLEKKAGNLRLFGIDIQTQMMVHCCNNLKKWKYKARICRADAERLPFHDSMFDVVFHCGAFNMFKDRQKALNEMIRVAKPGTRIVVADESEKGNRIFNRINGTKIEYISPETFVPANMEKVSLTTIWEGFGYLLAFTKPR